MKMSCKYCGIVNKPHKCPHQKTKWNKDNNRTDKKIYRTIMWQKTRNNILDECNHICLWSLYIDGIITRADTVHHIVELLDDESLAFDYDNLIPIEQHKHRYIHEIYKTNKNEVQQLLKKMIKSYREGDITFKKYNSEFRNISPPTI